MNKRLSTLMMLIAVCFMTAMAQKKEPTTANYVQACEAIDSADYETAQQLLQVELKKRPKDGYVWSKLCNVYMSQYDLDSAFICIDNAIKYLPKKDTENVAEAYGMRGVIRYFNSDLDKSLEDFSIVQKMKPEDETSYYIRSTIFKNQEKYAESDAELKKMLNLYGVNRSEVYTTLAKNLLEREEYSQALNYINQAYELDRTTTDILIVRSDAHLGMGNLQEAINDAVEASKIDFGEDGFKQLGYLASDDANRSTVIARAKKELESSDHAFFWNYLLHTIYGSTSNNTESLRYLLRTYKSDNSPSLAWQIAQFLGNMEINDKAYEYAQIAINHENTDAEMLPQLKFAAANMLFYDGKAAQAIEQLNLLKDLTEEDNAVNQRIAEMYLYERQPKEALKYMRMIEDEDAKNATYWEMLARIYLMDGDKSSARMATQNAFNGNPVGLEKFYAFALNGDHDNTMASILEYAKEMSKDEETGETPEMTDEDIENVLAGNLNSYQYNIACIYSLIGEKEKAISHLTEALKDGWKDFRHIDVDTDLDNIRQEADFQSLLKMYRSLADKEKEELLEVMKEEQ